MLFITSHFLYILHFLELRGEETLPTLFLPYLTKPQRNRHTCATQRHMIIGIIRNLQYAVPRGELGKGEGEKVTRHTTTSKRNTISHDKKLPHVSPLLPCIRIYLPPEHEFAPYDTVARASPKMVSSQNHCRCLHPRAIYSTLMPRRKNNKTQTHPRRIFVS